ncbi:MAG TPA: SDR family NAD(P)-dependent oxidoreductase [Caulobacteraceae bacterium]|jgi:NAD(P)-dependent dehydrogenase (short-subunit alcohol dehydrogenase family)|nr:SDR family NAD(P)-dependent oxidoreductase [Caulobacteraceae bacterium]
MAEFANERVLVLGGSRGIGAVVVRHFANCGAAVTFSYAGSEEAAAALSTAPTATDRLSAELRPSCDNVVETAQVEELFHTVSLQYRELIEFIEQTERRNHVLKIIIADENSLYLKV